MNIFLLLFLEFFKMGALTFGGGYAMIPFIEETVLRHGWMTTSELVDFIAVSESTPGAFAVNISTYIGSEVGGIIGALLATLGLVLPPFLIIILIAKVYEKIRENRLVQGAMMGLKATVVGLIAATVLSVGQEIFFSEKFNVDKITCFIQSFENAIQGEEYFCEVKTIDSPQRQTSTITTDNLIMEKFDIFARKFI